jgi:hypothetical protein
MTGQLWRDNLRQPGQDSKSTITRTRQPRQEGQDRKAKTGRPRQDSQDRTAKTEQPSQTAKTGQPGQESKDKRATTGEQRQDKRDRTSGTGHRGTGNPRQNIRDMTAPWQVTWNVENIDRTQARETSSYKGCQHDRIYGLIPTQLLIYTSIFWPLLNKKLHKNFKM